MGWRSDWTLMKCIGWTNWVGYLSFALTLLHLWINCQSKKLLFHSSVWLRQLRLEDMAGTRDMANGICGTSHGTGCIDLRFHRGRLSRVYMVAQRSYNMVLRFRVFCVYHPPISLDLRRAKQSTTRVLLYGIGGFLINEHTHCTFSSEFPLVGGESISKQQNGNKIGSEGDLS